MVLIQSALPDDLAQNASWLTEKEWQVTTAVTIVPFAAIAFLWFMGVLRDLLGHREDQFFATVFLGSGLLLIAGLFVWIATIGAALASASTDPDDFATSPSYTFAAEMIKVMGSVVLLRMAGVFMFSTAMVWLRTKTMPRWLVILTFLTSIALLVGGTAIRVVRIAFPIWVLIVSVTILVVVHRTSATGGLDLSEVVPARRSPSPTPRRSAERTARWESTLVTRCRLGA